MLHQWVGGSLGNGSVSAGPNGVGYDLLSGLHVGFPLRVGRASLAAYQPVGVLGTDPWGPGHHTVCWFVGTGWCCWHRGDGVTMVMVIRVRLSCCRGDSVVTW